MAQKHVVKISAINKYFSDDQKLVERGENAFESNHVSSMNFNSELCVISGCVHASMKDKLYKVEITLDSDRNISSSTCTCPRGRAKCHHVAALALFGHYNISVTDKQCAWTERGAPKSEAILTVEDLYPAPKEYVACKTSVTEGDVTELYEKLIRFGGNVGFSWLLGPKLSTTETPILLTIPDLIFSEEFTNSTNKLEYFMEKVKISAAKVVEVADATTGQLKNPLWLRLKKFKITASNFGMVLAACNRNRFPPSLFKKLTGTYNLDGIKAIQWGRDNEPCAVEAFTAATGFPVIKTGLWLDECGFIGASPDGLVGNDCIIEIKCPFKYRNSDLTIALESQHNYVVFYEKENKQYVINKKHEYYHQMQGQLHILKRKRCYLVIWTPAKIIIMHVERDEGWATNLNIIKDFYLNNFLENVISMKD